MSSNRSFDSTFVGVKGLAVAAIVFAMAASNVFADDLFWSPIPLNGGAANGSVDIATSDVGDTGTLFLYYDPTTLLGTDSISMDLGWTIDNVIAFQSADTFNFDVTTFFNGVQPRWDSFGSASSVTGNLVSLFEASSSDPQSTTGIDENFNGAGPFGELDAGYDADANAFFVGAFNWERVAPGETSLRVINPSVDGGTPSVAAANFGVAAIPEPSTVGVFAIGLIGLFARRRRK